MVHRVNDNPDEKLALELQDNPEQISRSGILFIDAI